MLKNIIKFIVVIGIITIIFGTIYATVQQDYRQSANDPQIQVAEDTAKIFSTGDQIQEIAAMYPQINFAQSLAPFIILYDEKGQMIFSTGNMDNKVPTPPIGVLESARTFGENRLTWQPRRDVRIATVIVPYSSSDFSGFILVGRNLREVEIRESHLTLMVFVGWILSVLGLILLFIIKIIIPNKLSNQFVME